LVPLTGPGPRASVKWHALGCSRVSPALGRLSLRWKQSPSRSRVPRRALSQASTPGFRLGQGLPSIHAWKSKANPDTPLATLAPKPFRRPPFSLSVFSHLRKIRRHAPVSTAADSLGRTRRREKERPRPSCHLNVAVRGSPYATSRSQSANHYIPRRVCATRRSAVRHGRLVGDEAGQLAGDLVGEHACQGEVQSPLSKPWSHLKAHLRAQALTSPFPPPAIAPSL
jgi:hypothetical protein